ncbi:MAG: Kae1-associated serine/threonine protein kinase [Candidatus Micrarchaeota archaeon]|nr:Kae1-associated serine/threonine protein kinase [Candidatus Micrarchaeota archaeon]
MVKVLAEGAESVVYDTKLNGIRALLKRRIKKDYRIAQMDAKIRSQRSKNEARIIAAVSKAGINAPRLILYDGYDLYMSAVEGDKLSEALKSNIVGATVFKRIGETLGGLHNADISHGDYTPANIILSDGVPYVIDFGLSEITSSVEEKALDVLLMKRSVTPQRYSSFLQGYRSSCKGSNGILKRLELIERRGRYQTRTLT